jgi:hypothetical protein
MSRWEFVEEDMTQKMESDDCTSKQRILRIQTLSDSSARICNKVLDDRGQCPGVFQLRRVWEGWVPSSNVGFPNNQHTCALSVSHVSYLSASRVESCVPDVIDGRSGQGRLDRKRDGDCRHYNGQERSRQDVYENDKLTGGVSQTQSLWNRRETTLCVVCLTEHSAVDCSALT